MQSVQLSPERDPLVAGHRRGAGRARAKRLELDRAVSRAPRQALRIAEQLWTTTPLWSMVRRDAKC